ncbi:MAG: beta-propeller fold lactonase family protein [Bacillota bacterium]
MKRIILCGFLIIIALGGLRTGAAAEPRLKLEKISSEVLAAGYGVKAVLLNADGSKVYSLNLEGLSVYEFDRASRKIQRKLVYKQHPGKGYNYDKNLWFDSLQEKPVEGCFTHDGRFLWISLHNAGGVTVWDLSGGDTYVEGMPYKEATLYERSGDTFGKREIRVLWIKTGVTPKIVTASPDGRYVFVANWHSNDVSVIKIDSAKPEDWVKIKDIGPSPIPRGLLVSPDSQYLYIAQMGSDYISVISLEDLAKVRDIKIGANPRHVIMGGGYLFVSLNIGARLVKFDLASGKIVKSANTEKNPRTIALSKDGKIVFVSCYGGNFLQAFNAEDLSLLGSWECKLRPVALDVFQDGDNMEVWVGNHTSGNIKVFVFKEILPVAG